MQRRAFILGGAAAAAGTATAVSFATTGSPADYAEATAAMRSPITTGRDIREAVRLATLAANSHNTQPWRFRLSDDQVRIQPDFSRRTPAVDPDDHHLFVSLGCAAENLEIAAAAAGLPGEVQFDSSGDGSVRFDYRAGAVRSSPLCGAILRRQSARIEYEQRPPSLGVLRQLEAAGNIPGVNLALVTDRGQMRRIRDLVVAGNTAQMGDSAFVRELKDWIRFNPRSALKRGDGLYGPASGNPVLPTWLGNIMYDYAFTASGENEKYARQLDSSAGLAFFCGDTENHGSWVAVGRACQRFALQATALGMKLSFVNQPIEVSTLRPVLAAMMGMRGKRPDILMRFGYGPDVPWSPRRPVEAVIT